MTKVAPARVVVGAYQYVLNSHRLNMHSTLIASHSHLDTNHRDSAVAAGRQNVWGFSGLPVSGLNPPEARCSRGGAFACRWTIWLRWRLRRVQMLQRSRPSSLGRCTSVAAGVLIDAGIDRERIHPRGGGVDTRCLKHGRAFLQNKFQCPPMVNMVGVQCPPVVGVE